MYLEGVNWAPKDKLRTKVLKCFLYKPNELEGFRIELQNHKKVLFAKINPFRVKWALRGRYHILELKMESGS